ncbi:MAG: hypothetical protein QUS33_05940 [Dehalococcoidia bacterium]|nr:hypothetical protein [Dehalococcoidia bacterium]
MVVLQTRVAVQGITGKRVTDFFINCTDTDYQRWWQGTHLQFHTLSRTPEVVGSLVYFDEYVGKHRLKCRGKVTAYAPGKRIEYQIIKVPALPAWLVLEFEDRPGGVDIVHTVKAGYEGFGKILDPLIRLHLSPAFERDLNEHARTEFAKLGDLLR